ncbi:FAD-dependent oxidoreductase [Ramlibacter sp.]|uniref:FAD-dependent oxidoreductase n=1 Tax=Ramlibacter sp. TaxID=1917967 RepID=UPI002CB70BE3|nr:FAD-dependent oxidoreductase [Ramlibacter sp.]HWI82365.1 FAD-dependent oxidoreductase [Ramlibacter sp.]
MTTRRKLAADVLVLGGGMAGLCAALTARQRGARVLVLEKGTRFGGSMYLSNGIVWTFARLQDARARAPDGDAALQDLLVGGLSEGLDWLAAQGVQLEPERVYLQCGRGRAAAGPQMTQALVDGARAAGATLLAGTALQDLLFEDGAVTGARAFDRDGAIEVRARSVVLATGGFQGNAELLARHVSPHAAAMYLRGNPWSTGDGLLAALDGGAATSCALDTFYGHALTAPPARFNAFGFQEMSHKYGPLAVALNLQGQRFTDESAGTGEEWLNAQIARQPGATAAYVFDADVAERAYEGGALARVVLERARQAGGPVAQADTPAGLADRMQAWGLPPDQVLRTLEEYNAAVVQGRGARLAPARRANPFPVLRPPFSAALVRSAVTFTCGGLRTDLDMRVLRRAASISMLPLVTAPPDELQVAPIPGLHAAGCDVGGFSTSGYLGGLAQALVSGRIAGAAAAG